MAGWDGAGAGTGATADADGLGVVGVLPPGFWSPDLGHFPKPVTRATGSILVGRLAATASSRWGLLLEGVDFAVDADGWVHVRDEPVRDPAEAAQRAAAAEETVRGRRWRAEAARWRDVSRAAITDQLLALQDEPLETFGPEELADHVLRTVELARRLLDLHMELHLTDMVPLGALLAATSAWGFPAADVIDLMRGTSPGSAPSPALLAARRSLDAAGGDWRARPEVAAYLRFEGHRLISEPEVACATLHEREDLVEQLLTAPTVENAASDLHEQVDRVRALRSEVPAADRDHFDDLLEDARLTFGVRDDNTSLTVMWPMGLVRRGYLEAARRMPALADRDDVFSAEPRELASMLAGAPTTAGDRSWVDQLAARSAQRAAAMAGRPPRQDAARDDWTPPEPSLMSPAQRWLDDAFAAYNVHFGSGGGLDGAPPLTGIGIGAGTATGPAVVAASPLDALDRVGPGSILVVAATAPAYDAVLPLVAGLVVETGGLLSHAALAARELGLPTVVGVSGATELLDDGEVITVDPEAGRISRAASSPRP